MMGYGACNVNDPGMSNSFEPGTLQVSSTSVDVKGYPVLAWDSPGLLDGSNKDDEYLQSMFEKCKDVQVFFYCVEMTSVRFTDQDKKAIKLLTEKFSPQFWKRAIVVLTKANMIPSAKGKKYHQELYESFVKNFRELLTGEGVPSDITKGVQFVAAGIFQEDNESKRFIWYASEKTTAKDDEKVDFLPELWAACFEVTSGKNRESFFKGRTQKALTADEAEEAAAKEKREAEERLKKLEEEQKAEQTKVMIERQRQERMRRKQQRQIQRMNRRIEGENRRRAEEEREREIYRYESRGSDDSCIIV